MNRRELRGLAPLLAFVALAASQQALAFHFPWDQGHDTTVWGDPSNPGPCEGSNCDPCRSTGSPVYVPTGHFVWTETDIAMPGRPDISLTRTYNSHDPRDGMFGNGWTVGCETGLFATVSAEGQPQYRLVTSNGKRYTFAQDASGVFVPPSGRFESVQALAGGSVRLSDQAGGSQLFSATGRLLVRTDPNGRATTYSYGPGDRLTRIADSNGRSLEFTYNSRGRVSQVTDHTGRSWRYDYDAAGNLISVTDPLGGVRRFEYAPYTGVGDGQTYQHLTRIVDASGVVVTVVSYSGERVSSYTVAQNTFFFTYNATTRLVTKRDSLGSIWRFTYDASGLITSVTDPLGNAQAYVFDVNGKLTRYTDALGKVWLATYDAAGRKLTQTDPLGNVTRWEYSEADPRPHRVISPTARVTALELDAAGNVARIVDPAGAVTAMRWDAGGNLVGVQDALGNTTSVAVNGLGLPVSVNDPIGRTARFSHDAIGNIVGIENPQGERIVLQRDLRDRPIRLLDPSGRPTTYRYDAAGRILSITDPLGNETTYSYDQYGRIAERRSADGRTTRYEYRLDNLVSQIVRPDGSSVQYVYDLAKRLTQVNSAEGFSTFAYSPRHELVRAANGAGEVLYAYNDAGRILSETNNGQVVRSEVNAEGERVRVTALGTALHYVRNSSGLIERISTPHGNYDFAYDAIGRRTRMTYPSGASVSYSYDAAGQLVRMTHAGAYLADYQLAYRPAGFVSEIRGGPDSQSYQYNADGELTRAAGALTTTSYTSDAAGNLLGNGRIYDLGNRLTRDDQTAYTYDGRGNLIRKENLVSWARAHYTFNGFNQLIRVERFASATAVTPFSSISYAYDALGRRISRTENGVVEQYVYDGMDRIATLNAAGARVQAVTFGPRVDEPLDMEDEQGLRYFHSDYLGSVVALSDGVGVTSQYRYDPFGGLAGSSGNDRNPFRFTGREYEAEDLYYYRARYYDPTLQRFLSEDPDGFSSGDLNLYRYVGNNPTNFTDPSGRLAWFIPIIWGAIELGLAIYDAYDTASTILDPCTGAWEEVLAGGLWIAGALLPGGGYSKVDDAARYLDDAGRRVDDIARRAPCGCFAEGSLVLTDQGPLPIEDVRIGTRVASKGEETGEVAFNAVTRLHTFQDRSLFGLSLTSADGRSSAITVTDDHPFWVSGRGWVRSSELLVGMQLQDVRGGTHRVAGLHALGRTGRTYSLNVADAETFFVGEPAILVHNGGPCDLTPNTLRPGPHADDSIPARGPERDFTPDERTRINEIGEATGCHTCGSTDPGTKSGNFVPDHQPPNALNPPGGEQQLYPHCLTCSRRQGGQVRAQQQQGGP
jgi:RHS repeat-associated protein